MQFRDLKAQYAAMKDSIDAGISAVINDCNFISGRQVAQLEEKLAEYTGVKHCIACANGTDALLLALMAWEIGPGDAVFVPVFCFFSSGEVVSNVGAYPVFVDVNEDTFNISPESLERMIEKTLEEGKAAPKVIVTVDLFGLPADYARIKEIAEKYHLKILEDAAQGFGGRIKTRMACSFGHISTTSLFPAKPYSGYILSYSAIILSLVTLAIILAAPMVMLLASPLIIGTCGMVISGMVTASFNNSSGSGESAPTASLIASYVA